MAKPYFIILFIFLFTCGTHAQDNTIVDSLNQAYSEAKHDTDKINCLFALGEELIGPNQDSCLIVNKRALVLAERNIASGLPFGSAQGKPTTLEKKYLFSMAEALNNLGYIYDSQGEISKALEHYDESMKIYEKMGIQEGVATALNNIGFIYNNQGDIQSALDHYFMSLKIYEEMNNKERLATSLNNIALIYHGQGDLHKALEYFHNSMEIRREIGDKVGIASSLNNIGSVYHDEGKLPKALDYYRKSLKLEEEMGNLEGIATSLNNIGSIYNDEGDIQTALEYYQKSLAMDEQMGNKDGIATSLSHIGAIEFEQGGVTNAFNYALQGLEIAWEIGSPSLISDNSILLSKVAKQQGNYQEALEMYELHIQMRDSIKNEETQKATIRQQTVYEFEKAQLIREQEEKENVRIETERTNRRNNLQYSVILIAILVLFGGVLSLGFVNMSERMAEGLIFFSFLILFEFLLVLADPYIDNWSGGAPGIKLLFNAGIAALIFPAHAFFESKLKGRLVNNNA